MSAIRDKCREVHSEVGRDLTWMSDIENHGVLERWVKVTGRGYEDCDGYMLTYRDRLQALGVPDDKMWLQTCSPKGGPVATHAVLRVRDDEGEGEDLILSNTEPGVESVATLTNLGWTWQAHVRSDGVGGMRESITPRGQQ